MITLTNGRKIEARIDVKLEEFQLYSAPQIEEMLIDQEKLWSAELRKASESYQDAVKDTVNLRRGVRRANGIIILLGALCATSIAFHIASNGV